MRDETSDVTSGGYRLEGEEPVSYNARSKFVWGCGDLRIVRLSRDAASSPADADEGREGQQRDGEGRSDER
jgi:hypothetical protein